MKGKQREKARRAKSASCSPNHGKWHEMNRKQRREVMRKMQAGDISLEVVHPHAAGIDIGNEAHYVAVPPGRDSQPVRRFGCTTAEVKEMADWLKRCGIRTVALQSTGVYWIAGGIGSVPGECPGDEQFAGAQDTSTIMGSAAASVQPRAAMENSSR